MKLLVPLKLINAIPAIKPIIKFDFKDFSFNTKSDRIAVKKGAIEIITPIFEAIEYVKAIFSSKKYKVTPHNPANAKVIS